MKYYKISEDQLVELIYTNLELQELEARGVENWEGFDECEFPPYGEARDGLRYYDEIE